MQCCQRHYSFIETWRHKSCYSLEWLHWWLAPTYNHMALVPVRHMSTLMMQTEKKSLCPWTSSLKPLYSTAARGVLMMHTQQLCNTAKSRLSQCPVEAMPTLYMLSLCGLIKCMHAQQQSLWSTHTVVRGEHCLQWEQQHCSVWVPWSHPHGLL